MSITAARETLLRKAADLLMTARRLNQPIPSLPEEVIPQTVEEAEFIQRVVAQAFAPIGGWKIGATSPEAEPAFAPMPAVWMAANGAIFRGSNHRLRGVEAEIAFHVAASLPPRSTPYTRDEVIAAMDGAYPAIEVLESAYVDPMSVTLLERIADMMINGGFVAGQPIDDWQSINWGQEDVVLVADGAIRAERTGSNAAGSDLVRLLVYLANEGAARTGGLKPGDWITTGTWTGVSWASDGMEVVARFAHAGNVSLQFEEQGTQA